MGFVMKFSPSFHESSQVVEIYGEVSWEGNLRNVLKSTKKKRHHLEFSLNSYEFKKNDFVYPFFKIQIFTSIRGILRMLEYFSLN